MKVSSKYRIFSIVIFFILGLACLLSIIYGTAYIVNNIIKYKVQNYAVEINNYFYKDVALQDTKAFRVVNEVDEHQWGGNINYLNLMINSINFFSGTSAVNIKLRNNKGQLIYSHTNTDISQLDEQKALDVTKPAYYRSLAYYLDLMGSVFYPQQFKTINYNSSSLGQVQSAIMRNTVFEDANGLIKLGTLVHVIVPLMDKNPGSNFSVLSYLEVYYDITAVWIKMENMRYIVILFALAVMSVIAWYQSIIYNKFQKVIDVMIDLNNRLRVEKQVIENQNIQKTVFLSTISHEMKTPLSSIIGYSEVILAEQADEVSNPTYKQYAEDIDNMAKYTLALVKDILDYAKATVAILKLDTSCFDIRKILLFSVKMVELKAQESAVKILLNMSSESLAIVADQKRFKQSVLNILTNAIKYTPAGGEIKIYADFDRSMKYDQVRIIFEDNGIGIAPKDLSNAVENYHEINELKSTKYDGTGLGLPFTKKLIELMGGKFEIESELGHGTKITFIFKYQDKLIS